MGKKHPRPVAFLFLKSITPSWYKKRWTHELVGSTIIEYSKKHVSTDLEWDDFEYYIEEKIVCQFNSSDWVYTVNNEEIVGVRV